MSYITVSRHIEDIENENIDKTDRSILEDELAAIRLKITDLLEKSSPSAPLLTAYSQREKELINLLSVHSPDEQSKEFSVNSRLKEIGIPQTEIDKISIFIANIIEKYA